MRALTALRRCRRARQKRMLENFLQVLRVLLTLPACPGHISASLHRQRTILSDLQSRMTREQWLHSFRMELCDVQSLFSKIADDLFRNPVKASNSAGSAIQPEVLLLMALRWCAGGLLPGPYGHFRG